ncbi:MAG TPA: shikimate dehydrogenase [Smithella sp.]|nr:shikimate dehydrogenase [Smithella sp.]
MICIPVVGRTNKEALHAIERICQFADCVELRMDLIARGNLGQLIAAVRARSTTVKVIVTCRKKEEAAPTGRRENVARNLKKKMSLLKEAIERGADFIDIELAEGEAAIHELKRLCAEKGNRTGMIVSYHNVRETPPLEMLKDIFYQCAVYRPAVVKIVTMARAIEDNLTVLNLIAFAKERSQNIIALCMGDKGGISRAIAPFLGNYLSFATLEKEGQSAPGQFTVYEMKQFEEWFNARRRPAAAPRQVLAKAPPSNYVLLGNPVTHSLSLLMHNAALKKMGRDERYSAFCVQDVGGAVEGVRAMNIRGASVTIPLKVAVMEFLDDVEDDALEIGAVNTIVNDNGRLIGCNTDWRGLILTLKKKTTIKNKTFVVLGAGGTARAAAYGIIREGGHPVIVNRTEKNGRLLAEKFGCPFYKLSEIGRVGGDCLLNTTSVGLFPRLQESPVQAEVLERFGFVMDVIYNPLQTKLLKDAAKRGCRVFSGVDMFVHQGAEQLRIWTGQEPPFMFMKKVVLERLKKIG